VVGVAKIFRTLLKFSTQTPSREREIKGISIEALAKVIFVILSAAKDLDSSVACGSLRMTDM